MRKISSSLERNTKARPTVGTVVRTLAPKIPVSISKAQTNLPPLSSMQKKKPTQLLESSNGKRAVARESTLKISQEKKTQAVKKNQQEACGTNYFYRISIHVVKIIIKFCADSALGIVSLRSVCKRFRYCVDIDHELWVMLFLCTAKKEQITFLKLNNLEDVKAANVYLLREYIYNYEKQQAWKQVEKFLEDLGKCFNYGAIKFNTVNKILKQMDLSLLVTINKKTFTKPKFVLKSDNFSSRLVLKFDKIQEFSFNRHEKLDIVIEMKNNFLRKRISLHKTFDIKKIISKCTKQKAFNYYIEGNFLFSFFDGDDKLLYFIWEVSAIDILEQFKGKLLTFPEMQKTQVAAKLKAQNKKIHSDLAEYIRFQTDFELIFTLHNSVKSIYSFIDTKLYPSEFNKEELTFFKKLKGEGYFEENKFILTNQLGMSESIEELLLIDIILKDRERYILKYSGFVFLQKIQGTSGDITMAKELTELRVLRVKEGGMDFAIEMIKDGENKLNAINTYSLKLSKSVLGY